MRKDTGGRLRRQSGVYYHSITTSVSNCQMVLSFKRRFPFRRVHRLSVLLIPSESVKPVHTFGRKLGRKDEGVLRTEGKRSSQETNECISRDGYLARVLLTLPVWGSRCVPTVTILQVSVNGKKKKKKQKKKKQKGRMPWVRGTAFNA